MLLAVKQRLENIRDNIVFRYASYLSVIVFYLQPSLVLRREAELPVESLPAYSSPGEGGTVEAASDSPDSDVISDSGMSGMSFTSPSMTSPPSSPHPPRETLSPVLQQNTNNATTTTATGNFVVIKTEKSLLADTNFSIKPERSASLFEPKFPIKSERPSILESHLHCERYARYFNR